MDAVAFTDARRRLAELADEAASAPVYITRSNGETLVLMNAREWASVNETAHLLSTAANRDALARSLDQAKQGKTRRVAVDAL